MHVLFVGVEYSPTPWRHLESSGKADENMEWCKGYVIGKYLQSPKA